MNATMSFCADVKHPWTNDPGYEAIHLESVSRDDLNSLVETKVKEGWDVWINGDINGKPAAYLIRKKQPKKE